MNYLKVNKERFNLTLQDIETETGIHHSKLSRLQNCESQRTFEERCKLSDFNRLKKLFTELQNIQTIEI